MQIMRLKTTTEMIIAAHGLSWIYYVIYMINELLVVYVCLPRFYMDLLSWSVGPYKIEYKMLVVSLCQLRYFQMEIILYSIFQGDQVFRYHSWTKLDTCPLWGT